MPVDFQDQVHYAGHMSSNVSTCPGVGDFLGVGCTSCGVAEVQGIVWALMYALQLGLQHIPQVEVRYDSKYAFDTTNSVCKAGVLKTLATIASGICSMVRSITRLTWQHEPSHEADPSTSSQMLVRNGAGVKEILVTI